MSKLKEFYGELSVAIRVDFTIKAESKEEARRKIMEADCLDFRLLDEEMEEIEDFEINSIDWEMIGEARRGNVRQSYIGDFEIYEY
ncbi:hypothetical protein KLF37_07140 [Clostridium perfringens]|uniref:hypothetical protein n=1 Tax=Clostridium perfringens TaxID=1502 RepID=UPI001CCF6302|nr:hypothetical protein [Clostridium perfringens]UBK93093.1 hypothetical protein KLF37_07140 [Clostridium perfringens]